MTTPPISVAISVIINNDKILLIKRVRGDYVGLWGLPGGKIEKDEHLSSAAVREIFEETGLHAVFRGHAGIVSEHLVEDNVVLQHFLLHICELDSESSSVVANNEGQLEWFDLKKIPELKENIIPSDYFIIERMVKNKEKNYYNCIIEKVGNLHVLSKFE